MTSKVAITKFIQNAEEKALKEALDLIGGVRDLNTPEKTVVIKVGVFSHKVANHTSVRFVDGIIRSFSNAPKIVLAESDNYQGTGLERLQIWKELFSERVAPINLSDLKDAQNVTLAGQKMKLSSFLFKPNVLINTHILRTFTRGSILKNLFGCIPIRKKAKFHKTELLSSLLADIYEAIGGIDLSVMDGTHLWRGAGDLRVRMNTLLVGRDAVAVETVGAILAGLKPEKMPVTQEFAKRGLGEANLENIEIVGTPLGSLRKEFKLAAKRLRKKWKEHGGAPSIWAPTIDNLIKDGFFQLPNKRTRKDVARAFEIRGVSTKGNISLITTTLTRRVKKGKLKAAKEPLGWVYWTE
ncbi:MAG: DUF362 domain-containing protein [Candidatus Bathyarchaeota archaeon]|nr:MAG: DUF362 domain-containing protein [Candidatus Bathyarchaeota archaeon]